MTAQSNATSPVAQPRSLITKLCKIMSEVDRIAKNGRNDFHKYDYVMEADLVDAVRDKLSRENVFLFSNVDELSFTDKKTSKGGDTTVTTAKVTFTFVDGDSGEERSFTYYGQGEDPADKGAYKAFTGAVKYALMKTFLVPTGDDPENDENDKRREEQHKPHANRRQAAPRGRSANQAGTQRQQPQQQAQQLAEQDKKARAALWAACREIGLEDSDLIKVWILRKWAESQRATELLSSTTEVPMGFIKHLTEILKNGKMNAHDVAVYVDSFNIPAA